MKFHLTFLCLASWSISLSKALYSEDAGVLDFQIATTGHGVTRFVHIQEDTLLTTDASAVSGVASSSCYVASRKIRDGSIVWRRNVCSTDESTSSHHSIATSADGSHFYTVDHAGILRAWTRTEGNLVWEAQIASSSSSSHQVRRIWTVSQKGQDFVVVSSPEAGGQLSIFQASNGSILDTISTLVALNSGSSHKLQGRETLEWLSIHVTRDEKLQGVLAFVKPDGTTEGKRMFTVEIQVGNDRFVSVKDLGHVRTPLIASTLQIQSMANNDTDAIAVASGGNSALHFSLTSGKMSSELSANALHPEWTSVVSLYPTQNPSVIQAQGDNGKGEESMALYRFDHQAGSGWEQLYGSQESPASRFSGVAYCSEAELVVAMGQDTLKAYRHDSFSLFNGEASANPHERLSPLAPLVVTGDTFVPDGDRVEDISLVECSSNTVTILLSTTRGSTTQVSYAVSNNDSINAKVEWTAEEGLASVSSAVVLDASHLGVDDLVEEQDVIANKLSFSNRLSSQIESLRSLVFDSEGEFSRRDHIFGFVKIAALLSQSSHRIWGIMTSGSERGSIRWSLDLPKAATFHAMVHGTTNSAKAVNGINGGTDSREILVVSASPDSVEWKCVDGTNGAIHSQDLVAISSPVIQVVPIYGHAKACRQASLLLHEDRTMSVVPGDAETFEMVQQQLKNTPNGMFTHALDKGGSKLESFQIVSMSNGFSPRQVGRTSFAGEKIAKVAYPIRDEVVQTLCTVLGDNSLLLKYVNPHLAVVITFAEDGYQSESNLVTSIEKSQGITTSRKPAGAGDAAAAVADKKALDGVPNMFVNLVDTVSGRILHRASHANADSDRETNVLVSENWVIYSFTNLKTRRTELGVLTLHEGMIDSKGISLFNSPDQTTTFSSFDARESKPVVLSKTYTYPKLVTALGVTATRGGISSRKILIASDDGKITSIGRMMLETRRPLGQVKDIEKKEGLVPYNELVMQVPFMALTYNHTIESVRTMVSAPTALESQSLILAFGGPDLFFTRTSPSRGFDLLPDSFSRILVSFVTVGLVIVLFVVRRMGSQKVLNQVWS